MISLVGLLLLLPLVMLGVATLDRWRLASNQLLVKLQYAWRM